MIRVVVTGGRYYSNQALVNDILDAIHKETGISVIIQGECPYGGADRLAKLWALYNEIPCIGFYGRRDRQTGKFLGPERNKRMIDEGKPDLVVAFPGDRGTANCVSIAEAAGITVRRIFDEPEREPLTDITGCDV